MFRTLNQWKDESSNGLELVCPLSYFVWVYCLFFMPILKWNNASLFSIMNHESRSRKKNILVLRSLWILPASKSITHHMFSTDGADVFTDQRTVTISSRGSSLPIQHRIQSQGSSVHICQSRCRFLMQRAAVLALRSPMWVTECWMYSGHMISDQWAPITPDTA